MAAVIMATKRRGQVQLCYVLADILFCLGLHSLPVHESFGWECVTRQRWSSTRESDRPLTGRLGRSLVNFSQKQVQIGRAFLVQDANQGPELAALQASTPSSLPSSLTTTNDLLQEIINEFDLKGPWKDKSQVQSWAIRERISFVLKQLVDAAAERVDAATRADELLQQAIYASLRWQTETPSRSLKTWKREKMKPKLIMLNWVLAAYAAHAEANPVGRVQALVAQRTEELLQQWHELADQHIVEEPPDLVSYNTVLTVYGRMGNFRKAQQLFDSLLPKPSSSATIQSARIAPDAISYWGLLRAYATAGKPDQALSLLQKMNHLSRSRHRRRHRRRRKTNSSSSSTVDATDSTRHSNSQHLLDIQPTLANYNDVLTAYANARQPAGALAFLQGWMQQSQHVESGSSPSRSEINDKDDDIVKPDVWSYNIVLNAMCKQSDPIKAFQSALQFWQDMPIRDIVSYTTLISAACAVPPSTTSLQTVDDYVQAAWQNLHWTNMDAANAFVSNVLYSLSIHAHPDMPIFAEYLVRDMIQRQRQDKQNNAMMSPNISVYNALLNCWAKATKYHVQAADRVLEILAEMEDSTNSIEPDVKTYTSVLDALKSRPLHQQPKTRLDQTVPQQQQQQQAPNQEVLNEVELSMTKDIGAPIPSITADVVTSMAVESDCAWVEQAEDVFARMERRGIAPNVHCFTVLIQNYARSSVPHKAAKAFEVLERMMKAGVEPNIITYNCILNACEHTNPIPDKEIAEQALKVALAVLDEIRARQQEHESDKCKPQVPDIATDRSLSSPQPLRANHVTYATFLGVMGNLLPTESRSRIIRLVFERCCREGQVSKLVLRKLREATARVDEYRELLKGHREDDLPANWTTYVRDVRARNAA